MYLREDGTPYYVGKGTLRRAFNENHNVAIPPKDRIILEPHTSEDDAFFAEKFLIAYYGRIDLGTGCLRNLTDGGEGAAGIRCSEEKRRKISAAHRGRKKSEETCRKMSESRKGKPQPHMIGNQFGKNAKHARPKDMRGLQLGRGWWKGKKFSEASRKKMSESHKGKFVLTEESRQQMKDTANKRWGNR